MALQLGSNPAETFVGRPSPWNGLASRLRGLIAARLVALTSALLPILIFDITQDRGISGRSFLATWAGAAYLGCLIYSVLLQRRRPDLRWQATSSFSAIWR